ncbi:hypothetical protein ACLQ28_15185 [Micromonospora sp. DT201]|uniref:hypothetical protein n=1 Tax=Micromonospora sp. DT201 TaxID=3393442 RepID=UPI003CF8B88C
MVHEGEAYAMSGTSSVQQAPSPRRLSLPDDFQLPPSCLRIVDLQCAAGREALTGEQRAELAETYRVASCGPPAVENALLRLLTRSFSTESIPEYYRYTDLHVFGWFLSFHRHDPMTGAVLALYTSLTWLLAEEERVAGHESAPEYVPERLDRLRALVARVLELPMNPSETVDAAHVIERSRNDSRLAWRMSLLGECTGFPQSADHHENLFLRAVHACEVVFFAVRWLACRAIAGVAGDRDGGMRRMRHLTVYAGLFNEIFHVLRTLSPEMFMVFREATGAASAVQSLNYHLMELVLYGYDARKAEVFERFPHLAYLRSSDVRVQQSLRSAVLGSGDEGLREMLEAVDGPMLAWRGRHYGFGRRYLADIAGSGGTEGAAYLKRFVRKELPLPAAPADDPSGALLEFAYR